MTTLALEVGRALEGARFMCVLGASVSWDPHICAVKRSQEGK
jgi:hypothetical protein